MKLFATSDVTASIRKAHADFTHIHVQRNYWTVRPVYLKSAGIADLPIYVWASWEKATSGQLERWRRDGGVLIDREARGRAVGGSDVVVLVECPMKINDLAASTVDAREYSVVPRPAMWDAHELSIDLRTPSESELQRLWRHCQGKRMTDLELAELTGIPKHYVAYMRRVLRPREEWEVRARLAPESPAMTLAWEWAKGSGVRSKREVRASGHRAALREMARLGHIVIEKYQVYPDIVDWSRIAKAREQAIADLDQIRALIESLPDHLQA